MAKVFPKQDMHVGGPNGGVFLRSNIGWRGDHQFVVAHPDLFAPPEYDEKAAENDRLRDQLAALQVQIAELTAAKTPPRKATA
jgi:hypothetical protein